MKLVITSTSQMVSLLKNNPALSGIGGLSSISAALNQPTKSSNCGPCNKNLRPVDMNVAKGRVEASLASLTMEDVNQIKSILNLTEFCYYRNSGGSLNLVCF